MQEHIKTAPPAYVSFTCIPFYDSNITENKKKLLGECQVHQVIKEKIKAISLLNLSSVANKQGSIQEQA
jgi:hypothetical protein